MLGWKALYPWIMNNQFLLLSVVLLASLIWNIFISRRLRGLVKIVKTNHSISPMLETWHVSDRISGVDDQLKDINNNLKQLRENQELLQSRSLNALQKIGLVRFDAFPDAGGHMSFSLALLDDVGMGVVVTSLFGREECRLFAKPLIQNSSTYPLSEEEKAAIAKAKKP
ncbi:MAG: DUF4446 family protein [Bacillota bacterium]